MAFCTRSPGGAALNKRIAIQLPAAWPARRPGEYIDNHSFSKVYRLLRLMKRKLSRVLRKWFVYLAIAGLAGNFSRMFDHLSLWKQWRIAKGLAAYLMAT